MTTSASVTQLPPHNKETEMAVLSAMLQDPAYAINETSSSLVADYFYLEKHKKIFSAIISLYDQSGGGIDLVGLSELLSRKDDLDFIGGTAYLAELYSGSPITIKLDYYIDRVRQYHYLRKILTTCGNIMEKGYRIKDDIGGFIEEAEQTFLEISNEQNKKGLVPAAEILKESLIKLEALFKEKREVTGVPSGIVDFDKITAGFQPSDLIILAARPAMGKTSLAINMATFAALKENKTVAIFSLEMAKDQLMMRVLSSEAKINSANLRKGFLEESDWSKLTVATEKIFKTQVFIDDSTDITVTEMRAKCRRLKAERGVLDLIIIDYLQLISGDRSKSNDSREREISDISRGLKGLAKELNCPVVALSQLNRSLESRPDKRPKPSDLRESGSIEQDADLIFFVYRDEVYHPESEDVGKAELIIGKNRHGSIDTVKAAFLKEYTLFQNLYDGS